jgi:protein-S-isoprenylcysteine O-methyltransferase Ste14
MKKRLKINGIIMASAALALAFFPKFFLRNMLGDFWEISLEVLGVSLILLGQIIRVSARGYKAEHSWESRALIQGGPYQVVRNPMYLGIFLIGLGVVLVIFKWWAILIFIIVFIIRYILLIYNEEKKLRLMFPDTYKKYCRKVPRIFPSLLSIAKLDIIEYLPIKITWFKKEIGSISTLLLLVLVVESWKDIVSEGVRAYFRQSVWLLLTFLIFTLIVILLSKRTQQNK